MAEGFEENRANRILMRHSELDQYTVQLAQCNNSIIQYNKELKALKYDADKHDQLDKDHKELSKLYNEASRNAIERKAQFDSLQDKIKY